MYRNYIILSWRIEHSGNKQDATHARVTELSSPSNDNLFLNKILELIEVKRTRFWKTILIFLF